MKLLLAPMEGLSDALMRDVLCSAGGYDWAVAEFARVTGHALPDRFFRRIAPELEAGGATASGVPVRVQLLGSDPLRMSESAAQLARLAPPGIDLNFGCPAPTVNRHRGGAVLLDEPELLHRIAREVRAGVPAAIPYSAKMRLGVRDKLRAVECAQALEAAGVGLLVVHARTKDEGYRPPAHWEWVGRLAAEVRIPVIANGEVWCEADWGRCRAESGVADVMLGRGAVADPFLARRIRSGAGFDHIRDWPELAAMIAGFWQRVQLRVAPKHAPGRLKQWLNLLRRRYPQAEALYRMVRELRQAGQVSAMLDQAGLVQAVQAA